MIAPVIVALLFALVFNWCSVGEGIPDYCMAFDVMPLDEQGFPLCEAED